MRRSGWNGDWPPPARPRRPADGIKAQSKRGEFAAGWWAKRWIAGLETLSLGARLARGRSYARGGQVVSVAVEPGGVRARVQGSRAKPYDVSIRLRELSHDEWRAVGTAIDGDLRLCAALLAGEMPENIESAFAAAGASLFPTSIGDLHMTCSCPDWSNPCKHVAAVFYLIGEEFDRDPFLLFVIRGLPRDEVRGLFAQREPVAAAAPARDGEASSHPRPTSRRARPRPVTAADFWGTDTPEPVDVTRVAAIATDDEPAVLKRAGGFPFWRADASIAQALTPLYNGAAAAARDWLADRADAVAPET